MICIWMRLRAPTFWDSEVLGSSFLLGMLHVSGGKTVGALESSGVSSQPLPASPSALHMSLLDMRRSVAELRLQLQQMRQLQVPASSAWRASSGLAPQSPRTPPCSPPLTSPAPQPLPRAFSTLCS